MNLLKLIFAYGVNSSPYYEKGRRDYYKQRLFPKDPASNRLVFNSSVDIALDHSFAINGLNINSTVNQASLITLFGKPRFTLSSFDDQEKKIITETLFYKWNTKADKTIAQFTFFENRLLSCSFEVRSLEASFTTKSLFRRILGDQTISFHNTSDFFASDSNSNRLHLNLGVTPRITIVVPDILDVYLEKYSLKEIVNVLKKS